MKDRLSLAAAIVALSLFTPSLVLGDSALSITNYQQVSSQRYSRDQSYYTYSATLVNTGGALPAVTATLSSLTPNVVIVAGQNTLHFPAVSGGGQVASLDTFTILVDTTQSFSFTSLQWAFNSPVANAGPNQSVIVGSTVTLNGSASTTGGTGTLTYAWSFNSKPAGSNSALVNPSSVTPTFVPDVPGNYVVKLTVNNGTTSSSATVTITATSGSSSGGVPIANAGPSQTVAQGALVTLDGSHSTSPSGNPLTFQWNLASLPRGSAANLSNPGAVNPTFVADQAGTYIVSLTVLDGRTSSLPASVTICAGSACDTAPVANPGQAQTVTAGATVQLDGSGSTDVDGNPLTYLWSFGAKPSGSTAQLSSPTAVKPTFVADLPGTYTVQLVVNDGILPSAAVSVNVQANPGGGISPPVANAGPDQTVQPGATVALNGSASTDPQHLTLTYSWSFTTRPAGSSAVLVGATTATPTFVADIAGQFVVQLTVNNGTFTNSDTVNIKDDNAPVANPGSPQTVTAGTLVTLNGSGSTDSDHQPLSYSWTMTSPAPGSLVTSLSGAGSVSPTFTPDVAGPYVIQLIVNDGLLPSIPVTVTITATPASGPGIQVPAALTVAPGQNIPYNVALSSPAQGTVIVNLAISDPSKASLSQTSLTINAGQTTPTRSANLTGIAVGNVTITASATGFTNATTQVTVGVSATLSPSILTIVSPSTDGTETLTLSSSTPSAVTFTLQSSDPTVVTVPSSLPVSAGTQTVAFKVTRVGTGTATITASATGYPNATATVNVPAPGTITLSLATSGVQLGQTDTLTVTLSAPAPFGGTTVSLTAGPNVDGKTAANFLPGTLPTGTLVIPQGSSSGTVSVLAVNVGSPVINASAPGYTAPSPVTLTIGATIQWTAANTYVSGTQQTLLLGLQLNATVPGGTQFSVLDGLSVNLTSSNPSVAIVASPASFFWDGSSAPVLRIQVTSEGIGVATIHASGINIADVTTTVTVTGPLTIMTTSLPDGFQNVPYSQTVNVVGGVPPYNFSATGLPGGLTINQTTGVISGSPQTPAAFSPVVSVSDGSTPPQNARTSYTINITKAPPASVTFVSGSPQSATIGGQFLQPLIAVVKDASGNLLQNVSVAYTVVPSAGGATATLSSSTANTTSNGQAQITATAGMKVGTYTVSAAVAGVSTPATFTLTNTVGAACCISVVTGGTQSAAIHLAFAPLVVLVQDAGQNPVQGVTVTFTVPSGGASATLSSGTAVTGADGKAQVTATANGTVSPGSPTQTPYTVTASIVVGSGTQTAPFSLTNTPTPPCCISGAGGTGQSAQINTTFTNNLQVLVQDSGNNPVQGVTVQFNAPANGPSATLGSGASTTAVSGANGIASVTAKANSLVGNYNVSATVNGVGTTVTFALTNQPGPAATVAVSGGSGQSAAIGTAFANLVALVTDAGSNPVPGVTVTFAAPTVGASAAVAASAVTGADGKASATATANTITGAYTVAASVTGVTNPANFALTNTAGPAASIAIVGSASLSAAINTSFGNLTVVVKDGSNNLVPGASVTFAAPTSGPSAALTPSTPVLTGASGTGLGQALVGAVANATQSPSGQPYTVTASVTSSAGTFTASFSLTNLPSPPNSIAVVSGSGQNTQTGTAFGAPLVVVVKDASGNPEPANVQVTFSGPTSGAGATFPNGGIAVTNAQGQASITATANSLQGAYPVTATTTNGHTATFAMTNTGPPANITKVSSTDLQGVVIFTPYQALQVQVLDGNTPPRPVGGVTVTFAVNAGSPPVTFPNGNTAVTDGNGNASIAATAGGTAGDPSVRASVNVGIFTDFQLHIIKGQPAKLVIIQGDAQGTVTNTVFGTTLEVQVTDAGGNGLRNGVTFTAPNPTTGPSGVFANGSNVIDSNANSSGLAEPLDGPSQLTTFTANGLVGKFTVVATADVPQGVTAPSVTFNIFNTFCQGCPAPVITAADVTVGKSLQTLMTITLTPPPPVATPANPNPPNEVLILTSSDPTKVVLGNLQQPSMTVSFSPGVSTVAVAVQGLASSGTATITIVSQQTPNNPQYSATTANVHLVPSGFVISGPGGLGVSSFNVSQGNPATLTVNPVIWDASGNLTIQQAVGPLLQLFGSTTQGSTTVAQINNLSGISVGMAVTGLTIAGGTTVAGVDPLQDTVTLSLPAIGTNQSATINFISPITVPVGLDLPSVGSLSAPNVKFTTGLDTQTVTFNASLTTTGNTNISVTTPAGYSTPPADTSVQAVVFQGQLQGFSATVGQGLQQAVHVSLSASLGSGSSGVPVTITSSDPTKLLFNPSPTVPSTAAGTITMTIPANHSFTSDFYAIGVGNSGTVSYTASAPGLGSITGTVTLAPAGLEIESPGGVGASTYTAFTSSGNATITVHTGAVLGGGFLEEPVASTAGTVSVSVSSNTPTVGTISPSPITIATVKVGGIDFISSSASTSLVLPTPAIAGTTTVTASATGFQPAQVIATYKTPNLVLGGNLIIGEFLQQADTVSLPTIATGSGVTVTITANSSSIGLAKTPTAAGTGSITLTIPGGSQNATFYVQNLNATSGSVQNAYSAASSGLGSANAKVSFAPSSIVILSQAEIGGAVSSTHGSNVKVSVIPTTTDGTNLIAQPLAGGLTPPVVVPLSSNPSSVVNIPANITLQTGLDPVTVNLFTLNNLTISTPTAGSTTVSISQPPGFVAPPSQYTQVVVNVN